MATVINLDEGNYVRSLLTPSGGARWFSCLRSVYLGHNKPECKDDTVGYPAAEGTVAHYIFELCLKHNYTPKEFLFKRYRSSGHEVRVTQNMVDTMTEILSEVRDIIDPLQELYGDEYTVVILVETYVDLAHLGYLDLEGGTADIIVAVIHQDTWTVEAVVVLDLKYGFIQVEVDGNIQTLIYTVGACAALEHQGYTLTPTTACELVIAQPRGRHEDGALRTSVMTYKELSYWRDTSLIDALEAATYAKQDEFADSMPNESNCQFCPMKSACSEYAGIATRALRVVQGTLIPAGGSGVPEILTPKPVSELNAAEKSYVLLNEKILTGYIDEVKKSVLADMQSGVPGYEDTLKLVHRVTHTRYSDDAFDELSEVWEYVEPEDIMQPAKPIPLGQLKKILEFECGTAAMLDLVEGFTYKPVGALMVVPVADKRLAVLPSAQNDFADFTEED